jgi:hypothetical protein
VRERDPAELGDRPPDPIGELASDDAEIHVDERDLDGAVLEDEHGGQEVHVDPLGPLVRLDAPAGVGDADGRSDDGAAHAGAERRSGDHWRLPPEGERRRSPSGPPTALIDAVTRWRRHGGYFWTVISRSATNGRDWLLM